MVGEVGLRTYEGVSQRIYSPPPLPLGTLPRSTISYRAHGRGSSGRAGLWGARRSRCQPRRGLRRSRDARRPSSESASMPAPFAGAGHCRRLAARSRPGRNVISPTIRHSHLRETEQQCSSASFSRLPCRRGTVTQRAAHHERPADNAAATPRRGSPTASQAARRDAGVAGAARTLHARPPRGVARWSPAILYGWHTVKAALENPARNIRKFLATENAARRLSEEGVATPVEPEIVRPGRDRRTAAAGCRASGHLSRSRSPALARDRGDRAAPASCSYSTRSPIRIMSARSCAPPPASRWRAVVTTARHSPEATGVLAKSASGALEYVPIVTVQNLARALETLKERGYLAVGLDSTGDGDLSDVAAARAARAGARRGGQGAAAIDARDLQRGGAARSSRPDQKSQRVECGRARALCRDQAPDRRRLAAGGISADSRSGAARRHRHRNSRTDSR